MRCRVLKLADGRHTLRRGVPEIARNSCRPSPADKGKSSRPLRDLPRRRARCLLSGSCPQLLDTALRAPQNPVDVETVGVGRYLGRDPGSQPDESGGQSLAQTKAPLRGCYELSQEWLANAENGGLIGDRANRGIRILMRLFPLLGGEFGLRMVCRCRGDRQLRCRARSPPEVRGDRSV